MPRRPRAPLRMEIVGLDPKLFEACMRGTQAVVESRQKGSHEISRLDESENSSPSENMADQTGEAWRIHKKIASIAVDFQRAYGRSVEIRVFERSSNRIVDALLRRRHRPAMISLEFVVNGVKVFRGVPQSFSQLDEAIDQAFGRPGNP